jgi:hypothetical protein
MTGLHEHGSEPVGYFLTDHLLISKKGLTVEIMTYHQAYVIH